MDFNKNAKYFQECIIFLFILGCSRGVYGRPTINGSTVVYASLGQNVTIECKADRMITWYRIKPSKELLANPSDSSLLDDSIKRADQFELYGESELPDDSTALIHLQQARLTDQGLYICIHEIKPRKVLKALRKLKRAHFTPVLLIVNVSGPAIEGNDTLTLDARGSANITCKGDKPVSWVVKNNETHALQYTDEIESDKNHTSVLELVNVNYTDVGYFFCIFNDRESIYVDHDHESDNSVASFYLFVKDVEHLIASPGGSGVPHLYFVELNQRVVIPCKPTFPEVDIRVDFIMQEINIKRGIEFKESHPTIIMERCSANYLNWTDFMTFQILYYRPSIPTPKVGIVGYWQKDPFGTSVETVTVVEGKNISINCSGQPQEGEETVWISPPGVNESANQLIYRDVYHKMFTQERNVSNIKKADSGLYGCYIRNARTNSSSSQMRIQVLSEDLPILRMEAQKDTISLQMSELEPVKWIIFFTSFPSMQLEWIFEGKILAKLELDGNKQSGQNSDINGHKMEVFWLQGEIHLTIKTPTIRNVGVYYLVGKTSNLTQKLVLKFSMNNVPPENVHIKISPSADLLHKGSKFTIGCSSYGNPLPEMILLFQKCSDNKSCDLDYSPTQILTSNSEYILEDSKSTQLTARRQITWIAEATTQGRYQCQAFNILSGNTSQPRLITITESGPASQDKNPLHIESGINSEVELETEIANAIEGDLLKLTCRGNNILTQPPLTLMFNGSENASYSSFSGCQVLTGEEICFEESTSAYSWIYSVEITISMSMNQMTLTCMDNSEPKYSSTFQLFVERAEAPVWTSRPLGGQRYERKEKENINLFCSASGAPPPQITWLKDDDTIIEHDVESGIIVDGGNLTVTFLYQKDSGKYTCRANNREGTIEDWVELQVEDLEVNAQKILIITISCIVFVLIILLAIFIAKVIQERKRTLRIKHEIQMMFEKGNPESLNPELDLGEQADLLPYDKKFEIPRGNIKFEKLLGSGEFGNVFEATALNLVRGKLRTTVAVKTIKSHADEAHMKSLRTELKIMIHIGRHINIVNLLGACSRELASKGELLLIVEYCEFGNILDFMRENKNNFNNLLTANGRIDSCKRNGKRRRTSSRSLSSPLNYAQLDVRSSHSQLPIYKNIDYSPHHVDEPISPCSFDPSPNLLKGSRTDSRGSVFTYSDCESCMTCGGENYICRKELERQAPLSTHKLLQWAYQIANGMFYLAEKKVIHGDLAARNILLAANNIVKISDFGLAKNIYKNSLYKKSTSSVVPWKWTAIEVMRDGIYSTQSDVWSYGIVLWEIFTLGRNPYPGTDYDDSFIKKLEDGLRLPKPEFASNEIYSMMEWCWRHNPSQRPNFSILEKGFGDILGESEKLVREYLRLNEPFDDELQMGNPDLLERIRTPNYATRVKDFFGDKDLFGYEKPISVLQAEMPDELAEAFDASSPRRPSFVLHPVPKRRRSSSIPLHDQNSMPLFVNNPTEYIPMKSPSYSETVFTFQDTPIIESPIPSEYLCMQTPNSDCSNIDIIPQHPYRNVDPTTFSKHKKVHMRRDSGVYSPVLGMQVNPEYVYNSPNVCAANHVYSDANHVYNDANHVYNDANHVYSAANHVYSDANMRIRLDSSSGVSSASSESSSSLEKKQVRLPNHDITDIQEEADRESILYSLPPVMV